MTPRAGTLYGYRRTAATHVRPSAPPMPAAAAQTRWAMATEASVSTIVGTVDLPPLGADRTESGASAHWRLRLVRESDLWRLVAYRVAPGDGGGLRSRIATVVVERLGDIRSVVERRWGDEAWQLLLTSAAPSLRSVAPHIMNQKSARTA